MSTDTPTGNGLSASNGHHADGVSADTLRAAAEFGTPQGSMPKWLPDEATLTRLASQFYGALTGGDTSGPVSPKAAAAPPVQVPEFGRGALPTAGVPQVPASAAPRARMPQVLGQAPGAPGAPGTPMPAAPTFYFITEHPQASQFGQVPPARTPQFDVEAVRADFPILAERINGRQLVYLDNAATTHKPQAVIDRLASFYSHENSNVHRGAHALAERATQAYEDARSAVAEFIGAASADDIVFTRGTTESINLVAQSWGREHVTAGDEIVLTYLEHHANIVPWQQLAEQTGAVLKVAEVGDDGQVLLDSLASLLGDRTRLVAVSQVSNVLGTIVPVEAIIRAAHAAGALALVDGAQAVAHMPVDVGAMDADFYAFSGHKVFGPTGIGALYAKPAILAEMAPWQGGGNMISDVTFERTLYQEPPARFEAGTANIAGAVGLAAALGYLRGLGLPAVASYEHEMLGYAVEAMHAVPGLTIIGTPPQKASVLSFVLAGYEPEDVGSALDRQGIAVRAGHHCAQPVVRRFGHESVVRPSLAMYNTCAEVDKLVAALHRLAADRGR
jgi:cysteine desulfurase / selenocysteine lyase